MNKSMPPALALCLLLLFPPAPSAAQRREHLTPEEIELVRDNQELDKRTAVFIKAAQRRVSALTDPAGAGREAAKESKEWGEVKGTRAQLLYDVARILEEAVVNIDDTHQRSPESALLRKALYRLSEAAGRLIPQLTPLRERITDEPERDQLERAIETAQEIVEAAKTHAVTEEDLKAKEKGGKKGN
ncbi:MAG TPA: hypothetical protein VN228_10180 [Pyrinomonadaceae bacterium]|nr:hypothetical protein [Pyrinomonadaceae bacterium]